MALSVLVVGTALYANNVRAQSTLPSTGTIAVPTYESVGLYWQSPGGSAGCEVKYRKTGTTAWAQGLAMWYDARDTQCRGSLVSLVPNTDYQVEFNLPGQAATRGLAFKTWSNQLPVAKTITVSSGSGTLNVAESGTAAGYVVYDGKGATLDGQNTAQYNVTINASYVIVRGLNLKGAKQDAIRISPNVRDVVIEDNDMSGWGRTRDGTWGADMDSGIRAVCTTPTLERVTIQRNKIHDPRYSANSWSDGHPAGPQAITISYCAGNHVIRHNEMYSTNGNYFNDVIGGEDNFTKAGFPNADTDIYGNRISHGWDDGIEAEGANENVRIWGNYIDRTAIGIATTVTSVGPAYIFRNVWNRAQMYQKTPLDADDRQPFFKSGSDASLGDGRRYVFHNTMLQAVQPGLVNTLGGGFGMGGTGATELVNNTYSKNNIYHLWKPGKGAFYQSGAGNQFSNDLYNGTSGDATETNGLSGTPVYVAGHGWTSEANGNYQIAAGTLGHGQGVRIANFNDGAAAPDVGAHQSGTASMKFGIAAATSSSSTGGVTGPIVTAPPPTPPPSGGTTPPTGSGSAPPSLGIDASVYSLSAGNSVTFTVSVSGNSGTPTGTINFRSDGASIANCGSVGLSNGVATCTTGSLSGGAHAITGVYSGNSSYAVGQAGPITVSVTGGSTSTVSLPTSFGIDSSSYTTAPGQSVTFTATIPGNGGTALFLAGDAAIAGCGSVAVANGVALCTTSGLSAGSYAIKAQYSGSGSYGSGVAGPITQTVKADFTFTGGTSVNVQGLWWGSASESGWGVNLTHQGDIVFATWFTYDAAGNGQWLVMSRGEKTGDNAFSGTLYRTTGPAFSEPTFDPARVVGTAVGTARLAFTDSNNGTFTVTLDGVTVSKAITRQVYGARLPTCTAGGSAGAAPNYQDLWWRPGGTESGWGLNLTHQGDILFMTWFTYDQNGKGMWLVASNVSKTSNGNYSGTLYRTTGPAFNSAQWDASRVASTVVGSVSFSFGDANNGVFSYTVNGVSQSKPITREVFSTPATVCS